MSNYIATVIKAGNSYALRVPKKYIKDTNIKLGEKVHLAPPLKAQKQDHEKIQRLLKELQALKPYKDIKDTVAW